MNTDLIACARRLVRGRCGLAGAAFSLIILGTLVAPSDTHGQDSLRPRTPLSSPPLVAHDGLDRRLVIKFVDSRLARARQDGTVESLSGETLDGVADMTARYGLTFRRQITLPESDLTRLEVRSASRSGRAQPDLAGMMIVEVSESNRDRLILVAAGLKELPEVEYVYLQTLGVPPPVDIPPVTPDLVIYQTYRGPDPGIDVEYAWVQGGTGAGIRFSDCEYGWNPDHEDLNDLTIHLEPGQTIHPDVFNYGWDSHGTAVLGETSAAVNQYGCSGMAPDAEIHTYPEWTVEEGWRRVACIASAINESAVGDVVLLEMQTQGVGGSGNYVPAEYDPSVWTVVRLGSDAGVIIVAAAGNGDQDLDSVDYQDYMNRGDSGSIIVGAGTPNVAHSKLSFSTYGSRVNVQGWGSGVFTLGYGHFAEYGGDPNQRYTDSFSGTSSASPFVASACLAVQSYSLVSQSTVLDPLTMRALLVDTGIPQGSGGHIGPLPDLHAAIDNLGDSRPDLEPTRRWLPAGQSLIGLPLVPPPGADTLDDVLLSDAHGSVAAFTWDVVTADYTYRSGSATAAVGTGYWISSQDSFTWDMEGVRSVEPVEFTLTEGWHLLGNPMWFPGSLGGVLVRHSGSTHTWAEAVALALISPVAWTYDNPNETYGTVTDLAAWHGYWFRVAAGVPGDLTLIFDWTSYQGRSPAPTPLPDGWRNDLALTLADGRTRTVTVGADPAATADMDVPFDYPAPPPEPIYSRETFYSVHPGWSDREFSQDIVGIADHPVLWDLEFVPLVEGTVLLEWDPAAWPVDTQLELYHADQGQVVVEDLRAVGQIDLPHGEDPVHLHVRTAEIIAAPGIAPRHFQVTAVPNPFNPMTTFHLDLARGGETEIRVFNLRGQAVRILSLGKLAAGRHETVWNGHDESGRPLASGIYFAAIYVDGVREGRIARPTLIR